MLLFFYPNAFLENAIPYLVFYFKLCLFAFKIVKPYPYFFPRFNACHFFFKGLVFNAVKIKASDKIAIAFVIAVSLQDLVQDISHCNKVRVVNEELYFPSFDFDCTVSFSCFEQLH